MLNKKNIVFTLLMLSYLSAYAQQDIGTNYLYNAWQINHLNPAHTPQGLKFVIALPGVYTNLSSPLSLNDLVINNGDNDILDIDGAIAQLNRNNNIISNAHLHTFDIALAFNNMTVSFGHSLRNDFNISFPKDLASLGWYGNASYVGQTVDIAPKIALNSFNQYSLGISSTNDNITIGGKLKLLSGIATLNSKNTKVQLSTSSDIYQLDFVGDYSIRTAGFMEFDDEEGIVVNDTELQNNLLFSENLGFAFDLGIMVQVNDQLRVGGSILDIGGIAWKTLANTYTASGNASFEGIDMIAYTQDYTLSYEEKMDSLLNEFNVAQSEESFISGLPTRMYAQAIYDFNKWFTFGGVLYLKSYQGSMQSALSANATLHLGRILDVGVSYGANTNTLANIGLSSVLNLGPLQLFAMTDNVLAAISPETQRNVNFRTGVNLIFIDKEKYKITKEKTNNGKKEKGGKKNKNEYYKNAPPVDCANMGKKKRKK